MRRSKAMSGSRGARTSRNGGSTITKSLSAREREPAEEPRFFPYSPIVDRPTITWPNNARVALWVVPNIEFYEFEPPPNPYRDAWPRVPHVRGYSWRDYGNRVGFWRMLKVFDDYDLPATVSLN